jgi:gliding motility-associated-like protein
VPNAVTANGDGLNDVFKWVPVFLKDFNISIYNRWGQEIFRSYEIDKQWDGTFNGSECPQDIYLFKIKYRSCDDNLRYFRGTITLVR